MEFAPRGIITVVMARGTIGGRGSRGEDDGGGKRRDAWMKEGRGNLCMCVVPRMYHNVRRYRPRVERKRRGEGEAVSRGRGIREFFELFSSARYEILACGSSRRSTPP